MELNDEQAIIIERIFEASPETVFNAWSDPEIVAKWWGPNGFSLPVCEIDFRVGGSFLYQMKSEGGFEFWYGGVFQQIIENELIVCTNYMADAEGNPSPSGSDWPDETLVTVTFEDLDGKTKLTLRHEVLPPTEGREHAAGGYSQAFDKLEELLKEI